MPKEWCPVGIFLGLARSEQWQDGESDESPKQKSTREAKDYLCDYWKPDQRLESGMEEALREMERKLCHGHGDMIAVQQAAFLVVRSSRPRRSKKWVSQATESICDLENLMND